jgi:two-component system, NarL family, nitrate/nitrite response regulator NarL
MSVAASAREDPASPTVTVYVADDHPLYRDGVVRALRGRAQFDVVGEASDGRAALRAIRALRPAVAVLDMRMPGLDGAEVLDAIQAEGLPTRVVLVSAFTDSELVYRAVSAGAEAYLSKDADREAICEAVAAVARGEARLDLQTQAGLLRAIQSRARDDRPALTPREQQVLELVARGDSAPEIGRRLYLSATTVKTHLQHLYEKLGVSDRAAAVAEAMRRGLLR